MHHTILTLLAVTFMFGNPMVFADGHTEPAAEEHTESAAEEHTESAAEEHTGPAFIKIGQSYKIWTVGDVVAQDNFKMKILKHEGGSWYLVEKESKSYDGKFSTYTNWFNIHHAGVIELIDDFRSEKHLKQLEAAAGADE